MERINLKGFHFVQEALLFPVCPTLPDTIPLVPGTRDFPLLLKKAPALPLLTQEEEIRYSSQVEVSLEDSPFH